MQHTIRPNMLLSERLLRIRVFYMYICDGHFGHSLLRYGIYTLGIYNECDLRTSTIYFASMNIFFGVLLLPIGKNVLNGQLFIFRYFIFFNLVIAAWRHITAFIQSYYVHNTFY